MYGRSILGQLRPLPSLRTRSFVVPAFYRQVISRSVSSRTAASRISQISKNGSRGNIEAFTPPLVIQRAVSSLLNDAFKNGTFSWDHTIASCLSVMLYSLAYREFHDHYSTSASLKHAGSLQYRSVSLRFDHGRMFASLDFSTPRRQHICHLAEHANPDYNSMDIVKLLYIYASRTGAIKMPLPNDPKALVWSHPERVIIPHMPASLHQIYPAMRSQPMTRQSEYVWHLAVLAAELKVPGPEYNTIGPFLTSTLPDHCAPPDLSDLVPQLRSDPQDFINVLLQKQDAPVDERERCRRRWLTRLTTYHRCPFACGYSTKSIQGLQVHTRICGYRSDETKASTLEKKAAKILECPQCEGRFQSEADQRKHIQRYHQRYEPFSCPVLGCGSKFSQVGHWHAHFQSKHTWPSLKCPLCDKEQRNLLHHLIHSHNEITREDRKTLVQDTRSKVQPSAIYRDFYHRLDLKPVPPILFSPLRIHRRKKPASPDPNKTSIGDCNHGIPEEDQ